ncbi:hypothetical protein N0V93_006290 [Gnomoniopsis smithogilvyi]|uniref:Uncharacterized protein n=1 Tax=Gnomoniopsis smithogilvyi TaxID=1191159 RepID=A0A9W8YP34_9PEZI|nr:hypothetical protein N0V93_006290 [Gnomoniopsis smithogilvyi]
MSAIITAVGFISSALGIYTFTDLHLQDTGPKTTIRVTVGVNGWNGGDGTTLDNAQGSVDTIKLYQDVNDHTTYVGGNLYAAGNGAQIDAGNYADIQISQDDTTQPGFTELYGGSDAICIATIRATFPDGSQWAWTGDAASGICNQLGYPSGVLLQTKDGGAAVPPRCAWLDKDHTNGLPAAIFKVYWPAFKDGWTGYDGTLGDYQQKVCGNEYGMVAFDDDYGPDFISVAEGLYCDMDTRTTTPLCGTAMDTGGACFDLEATKGSSPARRDHLVSRARTLGKGFCQECYKGD